MRFLPLASWLLAAGCWLAVLSTPLVDCGQAQPAKEKAKKTDKLKLAKAVTIAEQLVKAEAMKAKVHEKEEGLEFDIELVGRDGAKIKIVLDGAGKRIVRDADEKPKEKKEPPKKEADAPVEGKIKLAAAIGIAERLGSGDAVKAEYHGKGKAPEFRIELLSRDDSKVRIFLDPRGKRIDKDEPQPPAKEKDKSK